jgi:predicted ATP-dependent endonuclease of OLD family
VDARFTTAVLVEGISDRGAIEALAERRGYDLEAAGVSIVSIGGSKNITRWLEAFGPRGLDVRLAGLCDAAREDDFRRGLERAGLGSALTREDMERLGFFVCVEDLEDELIRSLGVAAVEAVIEEQGELGSFRTFQRQVEWRDRSVDQQLRRFLGTTRGRKIRSAPALVEALDMAEVPRPLARLLDHVRGIDG